MKRMYVVFILMASLCFNVNAEVPSEKKCVTFNWTLLKEKLSDRKLSPLWKDECGQSIAYLHMIFGSENEAVNYLRLAKKENIPISKIGITLLDAASVNSQQVTRILLDYGVSTKTTFQGGYSPLMHAVIGEHLEIMRMLLNAGADINYEPYSDENALTQSLRNGKNYALSLLIDYGINIKKYDNAIQNKFLFDLAYEGKNPQIISTLIKNGLSINLPDASGNTPLFTAIQKAVSREMIYSLLENGADRCFKNAALDTPTSLYKKLTMKTASEIRDYYDFFDEPCTP